jgi:hypothetical protein
MRSVRIALAVIAGTIATWLPTQVSASNDEARKDYIIVFSDRGNPAAERAAIAGLGGYSSPTKTCLPAWRSHCPRRR